jgi:hypothetical protein
VRLPQTRNGSLLAVRFSSTPLSLQDVPAPPENDAVLCWRRGRRRRPGPVRLHLRYLPAWPPMVCTCKVEKSLPGAHMLGLLQVTWTSPSATATSPKWLTRRCVSAPRAHLLPVYCGAARGGRAQLVAQMVTLPSYMHGSAAANPQTACAWVSHTAPCTNQPASHSQRPSVTRAQNPDFHTGELYDP